MNAPVVLAAILVTAVVFVLLPVAVAVFAYYRERRAVHCPLTEREAAVQVDAPKAAAGELVGRPTLDVTACSLWPQQDCRQACVRLPSRAA